MKYPKNHEKILLFDVAKWEKKSPPSLEDFTHRGDVGTDHGPGKNRKIGSSCWFNKSNNIYNIP